MATSELTLTDTDKGSVRIDRKVHERAKKYADEHGHRINFVYEKAITEFLARHKQKGGDKS